MNKILYTLTASLLLLSCGGGSSSEGNTFPDYSNQEGSSISNSSDDTTNTNLADNTPNTSISSTPTFGTGDQQFLLYLFSYEYLWYDKINTNVDVSRFTDPNEMIDALRYTTYDIWSYAETYEEYVNFASQSSSGSFGFWYDYDNFQIMNVIIGSPAQAAGLLRGDILTHINGSPITYYNLYEAKLQLDETAYFTIERGGKSMIITMAPSDYNFEVTQYSVVTTPSNQKVGLLIYDQFTKSSEAEFDKAFAYFKEQNIDELIIDLRYNGGGDLLITSYLMDRVAGYQNENALQFYLSYNANLTNQNEGYYFERDTNSLTNLSRIFFLTTEGTASASEIVINSFKPYMDVYTIGSTTHGKPVGMSGRSYGDYIYWLINFSVLNVNGEGEFYSGIKPTCVAEDNLYYQRDDLNEDMLKEALYYIENGTCLNNSSLKYRSRNHNLYEKVRANRNPMIW